MCHPPLWGAVSVCFTGVLVTRFPLTRVAGTSHQCKGIFSLAYISPAIVLPFVGLRVIISQLSSCNFVHAWYSSAPYNNNLIGSHCCFSGCEQTKMRRTLIPQSSEETWKERL